MDKNQFSFAWETHRILKFWKNRLRLHSFTGTTVVFWDITKDIEVSRLSILDKRPQTTILPSILRLVKRSYLQHTSISKQHFHTYQLTNQCYNLRNVNSDWFMDSLVINLISAYGWNRGSKLKVGRGHTISSLETSMLVLLAIHKNWNRSILGVVPLIYRICNLTAQIWFRHQPSYRISGSIEGTNIKITKIHTAYNYYSWPLIETGGITPWLKRYLKKPGRSGKVIRGFPGHLPGLGRQLPGVDI